MSKFDRIVSFNGDRFDFEVLRGYHPVDKLFSKSFDLLVDLHRRLGFRIKLDDLAQETLGYKKTGNGLEIVQWWREGRKEEVCAYFAKTTLNYSWIWWSLPVRINMWSRNRANRTVDWP